MIDGVKIRMGGEEYEIPPLTLKQIRRLKDQIAVLGTLSGVMQDEQIDAVVEIVWQAMARNYPDLRKEQVEDLIDLGNASRIIAAIMGVSGFVPGEPGPGES